MIRIMGQDEIDQENKSLDIWWNRLTESQKNNVYNAINHAQGMPERPRVCLKQIQEGDAYRYCLKLDCDHKPY